MIMDDPDDMYLEALAQTSDPIAEDIIESQKDHFKNQSEYEDKEDWNNKGNSLIPEKEDDLQSDYGLEEDEDGDWKETQRERLKYLFREAHFYMLKTNSFQNIEIAKDRCIWTPFRGVENKLNRSLKECRNVIVIFSVRGSGAFQGFARICSESRNDLPAPRWVFPYEASRKSLGGSFEMDWLCRNPLPFHKTSDICNFLNFNCQVKVGRDGQEIEANAGKMLCLEFDLDEDVNLKKIISKSRRHHKLCGGPPTFKSPQVTNYRGSHHHDNHHANQRVTSHHQQQRQHQRSGYRATSQQQIYQQPYTPLLSYQPDANHQILPSHVDAQLVAKLAAHFHHQQFTDPVKRTARSRSPPQSKRYTSSRSMTSPSKYSTHQYASSSRDVRHHNEQRIDNSHSHYTTRYYGNRASRHSRRYDNSFDHEKERSMNDEKRRRYKEDEEYFHHHQRSKIYRR